MANGEEEDRKESSSAARAHTCHPFPRLLMGIRLPPPLPLSLFIFIVAGSGHPDSTVTAAAKARANGPFWRQTTEVFAAITFSGYHAFGVRVGQGLLGLGSSGKGGS